MTSLFRRIKAWWEGRVIEGGYDPDSGVAIWPRHHRPRLRIYLEDMPNRVRLGWPTIVATIGAVAAIAALLLDHL